MDPGLQPQRTALAWQRTCLALYLGSIGLGFTSMRHGAPLISATALLSGILVAVVGVRSIPRGEERRPGSAGVWRLLAYVVVGVVVLALLGVTLAVESFAHVSH